MAELRAAERFRTRLLGVLGASQALAEHLCGHPADALLLRGPATDCPAWPRPPTGWPPRSGAVGGRSGDRHRRHGRPRLTGPAAVRALRTAYRRELLRWWPPATWPAS